jgi:uncharacterized membrane protein
LWKRKIEDITTSLRLGASTSQVEINGSDTSAPGAETSHQQQCKQNIAHSMRLSLIRTPMKCHKPERKTPVEYVERGDQSTDKDAVFPARAQTTIEATARLHAEHRSQATPFQRFTEGLTARAGQSAFVAWLTVAVLSWIGLNFGLIALGHQPLDAPPFAWMDCVMSVAALYMTVLILSTQRRDDELASHREQLALELAILGDRKSAKIIDLLEELRRDHPSIVNRIDREAHAMSTPNDPQTVLTAMKDSREEVRTRVQGDRTGSPTRSSEDK